MEAESTVGRSTVYEAPPAASLPPPPSKPMPIRAAPPPPPITPSATVDAAENVEDEPEIEVSSSLHWQD